MSDPSTSAIDRRGLLFVLSSPSGAGKTSIARRLLELEGARLRMSVSCTTRSKRPDEIEGRDYHFVSVTRFQRMRERGEFLEHAEVFGNWYATPREPVEAALDSGLDTIFDIDWQGAQQLASAMPEDVVRVFVLPPSFASLEERLRRRAQDSDDVVAARMQKAADELSHYAEYDFIVVNNTLDEAVGGVRAVLHAARLHRERLVGLDDFVGRLTGETSRA